MTGVSWRPPGAGRSLGGRPVAGGGVPAGRGGAGWALGGGRPSAWGEAAPGQGHG